MAELLLGPVSLTGTEDHPDVAALLEKSLFGWCKTPIWLTPQCVVALLYTTEKNWRIFRGISPLLTDLDAVRKIKLPRPGPVEPGLLADLLWADPKTGSQGFNPNYRGISVDFGEDTVEEFCKNTGVELILRGHQVVSNGYEYFANEKLITIFSAPNYCGEFVNMAAVVSIDKDLNVRIHVREILYRHA
uniref:Serine/threonine specific protein phosphatases domain-containing protein n=1 Tax=Romanomermis culicivorax TaxID=13658 RepID=A0A915JNP2_ROMCU